MSLARIDLEQLRAELSAAGSTMAAREEELDDTRMLAREAGATKSLFVANMSHELRTPLNGILGLTRNLLDSPLTPQQRSEVELIQVAGEDLVRIVNNVLDLSKLEAGKLTLEKVPFDLCELLEGAFCLLYPQAERKRLAYGISYSNRIHRKFVGDPFRLRQVALNLLSNAIKFTQSGMVMLHATDGELRGGAQWIRLQVEDTGIGIDSGKLRLIFDEFQQADLSTTRKYGGTGLGLSLSKRIVGLMGGEIDVESEPGQGSMFIVQIPLIPIRSADGFEGWHDEVLSLEGLNLLIQDRHSNQMSVMLRLLEALPGLSVERFSTAEEASTRILGSQGTQDAIDAVVSVEGSSAFSPAEAQRILRQIVSQPPLHIVLSENAGGPATTQSEGGTSVVLHAPLLPSRLIALLYQVRRIPVGPLFESAGLTAFDVYRDPQEKYREQLPTLVAHENPVELRLLEVMLQKLGRSFVSARTEADLLALLQSGAWHAFLIQGRMLQQSAANVLLPEKSPPAVPLRLALVGDAEDAVIHRVSESCVAFAHFYAMPRLSQLRDFFRV
ncbi:MAG: ATP-binding protein [Bryobacterales bacterium]|nr:ATP-binding protein [Bryobacterales bacterium]